MDKYLDKINKLLLRAMNLKISNLTDVQMLNEKDDIINKVAELYKRLYPFDGVIKEVELGRIEFEAKPEYNVQPSPQKIRGTWLRGIAKLVSIIDTFKERYELDLEDAKNEEVSKPEVVFVEDGEIISGLKEKLELANKIIDGYKNKKGFNKIFEILGNTWKSFIATVVIIGGVLFWFGFYVGTTKYEKEKIDMYEDLKSYKDSIESYKASEKNYKNQLDNKKKDTIN